MNALTFLLTLSGWTTALYFAWMLRKEYRTLKRACRLIVHYELEKQRQKGITQ